MAWCGRRASPRQTDDTSPSNIGIDPDMVIANVNILIDEQLGHGGYGVVFVGLWNGTPVAVKRVHSTLVDKQVGTVQRNAFLESFSQEWRLFGNLRHPFIVQFLGVFQPNSRSPSLVMELMDQTLRIRCQRTPYLTDEMTIRLCGEVLCALVYLHGRGIVHRDLTTNNVLLTRGSEPTAKVSDLGVARALFGDDPRHRILMSQSRGMTRGPGALLYMSPESTDESGRPYDTKHDMFSFGVLALATSVRHEPTCLDQPRRVPVGDGRRGQLFRVVPEVERREADLHDLPAGHPLGGVIRQCLRDDPCERPTAHDLNADLEHLLANVASRASSERAATGEDEMHQVQRGEVTRLQQELASSQEAEQHLRKALTTSQEAERQLNDALQLSRGEVASLQQALTTSQEAERQSREALSTSQEMFERRLSECAARERSTQEEVLRLQRELAAANEQGQLAKRHASRAAEECEQSRRMLDDVLTQRFEDVALGTPLSLLQRQEAAMAGVTSSPGNSPLLRLSPLSPQSPLSQQSPPLSPRKVDACGLSSYRWTFMNDIPRGGKFQHQAVHLGEWLVLVGGFGKNSSPCKRTYGYNVQERSWKEWISTPNYLPYAASDGQHLYIMGGKVDPSLDMWVRVFFRLSDDRKQWDLMPDMAHGVDNHGGVACHHGNLYVHARAKHGLCMQVFDCAKRSWSVLASRNPSLHCRGLVSWGDYIVFGDCEHYYDVASDKWRLLPRRKAGTTPTLALMNNCLIAVGKGTASAEDQHAVDVLHNVNSLWFSLSPIPAAQVGVSACVVDNKLFVTGGKQTENSCWCFS